jgi:hypothetical protein
VSEDIYPFAGADHCVASPPLEWLESLAELVAEKLRPVVCAEVRAALRSKGAKS